MYTCPKIQQICNVTWQNLEICFNYIRTFTYCMKGINQIFKLFNLIMRYFLLLFVFTLLLQTTYSQSYPKKYFRAPLDIPLYLSGTFGELRSNHFHSGIDIKTQGVQGKKVYAIASGYVSRIKVSGGGYGKTIYT